MATRLQSFILSKRQPDSAQSGGSMPVQQHGVLNWLQGKRQLSPFPQRQVNVGSKPYPGLPLRQELRGPDVINHLTRRVAPSTGGKKDFWADLLYHTGVTAPSTMLRGAKSMAVDYPKRLYETGAAVAQPFMTTRPFAKTPPKTDKMEALMEQRAREGAELANVFSKAPRDFDQMSATSKGVLEYGYAPASMILDVLGAASIAKMATAKTPIPTGRKAELYPKTLPKKTGKVSVGDITKPIKREAQYLAAKNQPNRILEIVPTKEGTMQFNEYELLRPWQKALPAATRSKVNIVPPAQYNAQAGLMKQMPGYQQITSPASPTVGQAGASATPAGLSLADVAMGKQASVAAAKEARFGKGITRQADEGLQVAKDLNPLYKEATKATVQPGQAPSGNFIKDLEATQAGRDITRILLPSDTTPPARIPVRVETTPAAKIVEQFYKLGTSAQSAVFKPPKTKLGKLWSQLFNPVKNLPSETQQILSKWLRSRDMASDTASDLLETLSKQTSLGSVPSDQGWNTIQNYQAGQATPVSADIRSAMNAILKLDRSAGFNIKARQNYLQGKYIEGPPTDTGDSTQPMKPVRRKAPFVEEKKFGTLAEAQSSGYTPLHTHPAQNIAERFKDSLVMKADKDLIKGLTKTGSVIPEGMTQRSVSGQSAGSMQSLQGAFSGYKASPELARLLNSLVGTGDKNLVQHGISLAANINKRIQEFVLSAGLPRTPVNFFTLGQMVKDITTTAGLLTTGHPVLGLKFGAKQSLAFVHSFNKSIQNNYFASRPETLAKMRQAGINIKTTINYNQKYKNTLLKRRWSEALGDGWNWAWNEKVFAGDLAARTVNTFEVTEQLMLQQGLSANEATKVAADVAKRYMGVADNMGRSKEVQDGLSAVLMAPRFRETLVNFWGNNFKAFTTGIQNPAFYLNRRFVIGAIMSYVLYNYLNKKYNDRYMWENPTGREFELMIPVGDQVVSIPLLPSLMAFPRNMMSGALALMRGEGDVAKQKFGSVLAIPVSVGLQILGNRDYWGNPIWIDDKQTKLGHPEDTRLTKVGKSAFHAFDSMTHPYIGEPIKKLRDPEGYDTLTATSRALELPLKWSEKEKVDLSLFYKDMEKTIKEFQQIESPVEQARKAQDYIGQLATEEQRSRARSYIRKAGYPVTASDVKYLRKLEYYKNQE